MALTQGSPLPDVTRTTTQTMQAPDWYSNYLQDSASAMRAHWPAFSGASNNQLQAFDLASASAGNWNPDLQAAANLVGQSTGMSAAGAVNPFLSKASGLSATNALAPFAQTSAGMSATGAFNPFAQTALSKSAVGAFNPYAQASSGMSSVAAFDPLANAAMNISGTGAFAPYAQKAGALSAAGAAAPGLTQAGGNVYDIVGNYMNPYTESVVNEIGRLGQENITRNLAPAAVSGAAGTGQFGSRRGAQVLGSTIQDALADVSGKQSQALFTGYDQATKAAQSDMARQLQAAVAAGQLTDSDAARILQAGTTAGQLATTDASKLLQAATARGQLTSTDAARMLEAGKAAGQLTDADIGRMLQAGTTAGQLTATDAARMLDIGKSMGQMTDADIGRILQSGELAGKFTGLDMANLMTGADLSRNLGIARGALSTQDIANLSKVGEQRRAIAMEEQMFPIMVEQQKLNALRGMQIPMGQTTTVVGPEPGAYGTSPLSSVAGIGTMLGQLFQGGDKSAASGIGSALKGLFGSGIDSSGYLSSIGATSDSPWLVGSDLYDYTGDQGIDWSSFDSGWGQP